MRKFNSYKDVKICCYAMAAGEPEMFIDRWLESMKGADYITVLITKENDSNWYYFNKKKDLPEYKNKLIIQQKNITPWRFDVARNESMKLIPEDSDVLICTDIDEILIEDFWDDYRRCVFEHPNFERILYQYAWSHDAETGEPKWYFWYDKTCQAKGWKWEYPVHEALTCPNICELGYTGTYRLNEDKIYLHHYPDLTKSRGGYLKLLELRSEEYKDDLYGLFYLAREYSYAGNVENALKTSIQLYARLMKGNPSKEELEARDDMLMLPGTCIMIGDFFDRLDMRDDAEIFYKKAIQYDKTFRDGYIKLGQLYAYMGEYNKCYNVLEEMSQNSLYIVDWRLTSYYWRKWKVCQITADAKCWEGKYEEAYQLMVEACIDIKTRDDLKDAVKENFIDDLNFVLSRVGKKTILTEEDVVSFDYEK